MNTDSMAWMQTPPTQPSCGDRFTLTINIGGVDMSATLTQDKVLDATSILMDRGIAYKVVPA